MRKTRDILKQEAATQAVNLIKDNMVIGLGTGSTAKYAAEFLGQKIRQGGLKNIIAIPTSNTTAAHARSLGIALGDLADYESLDLVIDGADEIDPDLNLVKGLGGALVREKLVEIYAAQLVIIADETKLVERLCTRVPLPIEVTPFAWQVQQKWLVRQLECEVTRRETQGQPFLSDNHNFILDCQFADGISDPYRIQDLLSGRTGIVGHGLFLNMTAKVIVATETGIKRLSR